MVKTRPAIAAFLCGAGAVAAVTFGAWESVKGSPDRPSPVDTAGEPTATGAITPTAGAAASPRAQDDLRRMREAKMLLTATAPTPWTDPPRR